MPMDVTMGAEAEMILSARPYIEAHDREKWAEDLRAIADSGQLFLGLYTAAFEEHVARIAGTRYAVALSSGTAALETAFSFYHQRLRRSRYHCLTIAMPTNSFIACAAAAERAGFCSTFCQISPHTFGLDMALAMEALRQGRWHPPLLLVVHIAGLLDPLLPALVRECREKEIPVIEDCAHAHGAMVDGRLAGSFGDAACFSFYATKVMTTGVGGALATDNEELAAFARRVRHHGAADGVNLSSFLHLGADYLLPEASAALGVIQARRLSSMLEIRRGIADSYYRLLGPVGGVVVCPPRFEGVQPAWYKLPVLLPDRVTRDRVRCALLDARIQAGVLYDPVPPQVFPNRWVCPSEDLEILGRQLALPVHCGMSQRDVETVCATIIRALVRGE